MPDLKISQLPVASTPLAGTELVPIVQGGVTDQTTVQAILTGTVPSGTANGVLYLNGSKVVSSGSALTFDGTSVFAAPRVRLNDANRLDWGDGGEWVIGDNGGAMIFGVDVSEQMRLNSTGLGVGTNNPTQKLTVSGSAAFSRIGFNANAIDTVSAAQSFVRFQTTGGDFYVGTEGGVGGVFFPSSTAYAAVLYNASSTPMQFYTAGLLRATLNSSGNLGLGVTPSAWVSGAKAIEVGSYAAFGQARPGTYDAVMSWNAVVTSGTSSGTGYVYRNTGDLASSYEQNGVHRWYTAASGTAGNAISFSQVMTLAANGNLLVGSTSDSGSKLQVGSGSGSTSTPTAIEMDGTYGTAAFNSLKFYLLKGGAESYGFGLGGVSDLQYWAGSSSTGAHRFFTSQTERASITSTGNVVAGGSVALATTATDGFLYVPTCAGTPTGTPTAITGMAPIVVNTTNNKLYFYSGGAWRDAGP